MRVPSSTTAFPWWVSVKFCLTGISLLVVGDRTFIVDNRGCGGGRSSLGKEYLG